MHTKVVHRTARLLSDRFSLTALRFNFRGVGASEGVHDHGRGEVEDVVAAARFVRERQPVGPFVLSGFSFGSVAALRASSRVAADLLLLIGLPVDRPDLGDLPVLERGPAPVVWIQGERDEYADVDRARALAQSRGVELVVVPGADHFFTGRLDAYEEAAAKAVAEALG
jgi:alpha/beta superfamily hydrolase